VYVTELDIEWIHPWIGLDWIGLDWIGLDWLGFDWIVRIGLDDCGPIF